MQQNKTKQCQKHGQSVPWLARQRRNVSCLLDFLLCESRILRCGLPRVASVTCTLQILFVVSAALLFWHDVVNVCACCSPFASHASCRVRWVTNLTNHAERVTRNDVQPELAPVRAVSTFVIASTVPVILTVLLPRFCTPVLCAASAVFRRISYKRSCCDASRITGKCPSWQRTGN